MAMVSTSVLRTADPSAIATGRTRDLGSGRLIGFIEILPMPPVEVVDWPDRRFGGDD